jgi:hypothetical protein
MRVSIKLWHALERVQGRFVSHYSWRVQNVQAVQAVQNVLNDWNYLNDLNPLLARPLSAELIRSVLPDALLIGESLRILFAKSLDRGC